MQFDQVTTFIGPNGAGKSTILRALDWFFNGTKTGGDLTIADCSHGSLGQEIEVQVTFDDLSSADRVELGKYAPAGASTFTAWKKRTTEGIEYLSANAKGLSAFAEIKGAGNATDKKAKYNALREASPHLALPQATSGPTIDAAIAAWESDNIALLEDVPEDIQTNFFGFNSTGKMSGLFNFVLVTADMRAGEESEDVRGSIIGRILERSIDRTAADLDIKAIVDESRDAQQRVYATKFREPLDLMADSLNAVVESYAPGRTVKITPSIVELKSQRTSFAITISDGEFETPVDKQGHGFQRTLLISSLQLLATQGPAGSNGVICLAIEEPELFQHPIQAQAFAKVLRTLAEDPTQRIQITYATHSPYFIEANRFNNVRRLTRISELSSEVVLHSSSLERVKTSLAGVVRPEVVANQLDGTIASRLPVALFANRVLIVEGTTDAAVICGIADRTSVGYLEKLGVSVVDVGGKNSIALTHAILTSMGIPCYTLFDADGNFEIRATENGKSLEKIENDRKTNVVSNRGLLSYFGLEPVDFPGQTETEKVTILDDNLETLLTRDWESWGTSCSAFETESDIDLSKNNAAYRVATQKAVGDPPGILLRVIEKAVGAI